VFVLLVELEIVAEEEAEAVVVMVLDVDPAAAAADFVSAPPSSLAEPEAAAGGSTNDV